MISHGVTLLEGNTEDDNNTLLHYAVQYQNMRAINLLLEHGANINAKNSHGNTCLHICASIDNLKADVLEVLLIAGACKTIKNALGDTPIGIYISRIGQKTEKASSNDDVIKIITLQ